MNLTIINPHSVRPRTDVFFSLGKRGEIVLTRGACELMGARAGADLLVAKADTTPASYWVSINPIPDCRINPAGIPLRDDGGKLCATAKGLRVLMAGPGLPEGALWRMHIGKPVAVPAPIGEERWYELTPEAVGVRGRSLATTTADIKAGQFREAVKEARQFPDEGTTGDLAALAPAVEAERRAGEIEALSEANAATLTVTINKGGKTIYLPQSLLDAMEMEPGSGIELFVDPANEKATVNFYPDGRMGVRVLREEGGLRTVAILRYLQTALISGWPKLIHSGMSVRLTERPTAVVGCRSFVMEMADAVMVSPAKGEEGANG